MVDLVIMLILVFIFLRVISLLGVTSSKFSTISLFMKLISLFFWSFNSLRMVKLVWIT